MLLIVVVVGAALALTTFRLLFKRGISFITGVFFIIQSVLVVIMLRVNIVENEVIDKFLGLLLIILSGIIMAYFYDKVVGMTFREMTKKINLLESGRLDITVESKHKKLKSEAGEIARSLENLVTSLSKSVELVKMVSEGKLFVDTHKLNENAELDIALKNMVIKLREMSSNIKMAGQQVGVGSRELSSTAQALAQGANEQASSSEEIASTMEQMQVTNNQNSENAERTDQIARDVATSIEQVNTSIEETTQAINNIAEKISIINDIAEKTDILAINAAIEAARAGESGKGFAVVATEVRDLAEHSQHAAEEIEKVSLSSKEKVQSSKNLLDKIYPEIKRTSVLLNEISAATREESNGIQEINRGIQQLSTVIQQNSASSEQMAASSEELNAQSEQLNESIQFFKLEEGEQYLQSEAEIVLQINQLNKLLKSNTRNKTQ